MTERIYLNRIEFYSKDGESIIVCNSVYVFPMKKEYYSLTLNQILTEMYSLINKTK